MQHPLRVLMVSGATLALAGLGIAAPALAAPSGPPAVLHVGQIDRQDVQAHGNCEPDTLVEPDIAVSPFNTKIEVAVAHDCRFASGGAVDISYAWTIDGGAHWQQSRLPGLTKAVGGTYDRASDPVVAFGADGSVYVSSLVIDINNCDSGVAVSRSTDGGATFADPVYAQQSTSCGVSDDKNWLVTDTQPNSPFFGRIYQFWTEFLSNGASPQVVRWSDDHGQHWSSTHFLASRKLFAQNSQPFVQPNGAITDTYLFAGHAIGDSVRQGILRNGTNAGSGVSIVAQTSVRRGCPLDQGGGGGQERRRRPGRYPLLPSAHGGRPRDRANVPGVERQRPRRARRGRDIQFHRRRSALVEPGPGDCRAQPEDPVHQRGGRGGRRPGLRQLRPAQPERPERHPAGADLVGQRRRDLRPADSPWPAVEPEVRGGRRGQFPGDYSGLSATPARVANAWTLASKPPNPTAAFHQVLFAATLRT